jgi:hypothetical protein
MQPDKKQIEVLIMQYFRECYDEFPKGIVKPSESPDFMIRMKNQHILGIELTRLNPGNASPLDDSKLSIIQQRENFIAFAKGLFEQKSSMKLFVKFLFSKKNLITPERKISLAVQVVMLIENTIQNRNADAFFKESIDRSKLPEGIDEVLIVHQPKLTTSVWERSNNLGISNDVVDDIRNSIRKKDEKLRLYQKQRLNYYWLLILTDRLRGVKSFNLPDKIMNHRFYSNFQHVFLFDLIKSDIYTLI